MGKDPFDGRDYSRDPFGADDWARHRHMIVELAAVWPTLQRAALLIEAVPTILKIGGICAMAGGILAALIKAGVL